MRNVMLATALAGIGWVAVFAEGPQSPTKSVASRLNAIVGLQDLPGTPVRHRQLAKVVFAQPVKAMNKWLLGTYVIEHDTDRMERGQPCTHIYKFDDRRTPVVTFFCEHLHRQVAERGTVTLKRMGIAPAEFELVEFQFEGSADGHGVPKVR
jgi:hypothetical protein